MQNMGTDSSSEAVHRAADFSGVDVITYVGNGR